MNVASHKLSRKLYNLTGWESENELVVKNRTTYCLSRSACNNWVNECLGHKLSDIYTRRKSEWDTADFKQVYEAYDLGFLMAKMPKHTYMGGLDRDWETR